MSSFKDLVDKISFSCFPIPIHVHVRGAVLKVVIETTDRDSGKPTSLVAEHAIPAFLVLPRDEERAVKWVYEQVRSLVEHELLESLTVDGDRRLDPHLPTHVRGQNREDTVKDLFGDTLERFRSPQGAAVVNGRLTRFKG